MRTHLLLGTIAQLGVVFKLIGMQHLGKLAVCHQNL